MKLDIRVTGLVASLLFAGGAQATNGYFTDGVGAKNMGMAGAGSADPREAMILATNPAGIAFVGDDLELGLELFSPDRSYSSSPSLANGNGGAFTIGPNDLTSGNRLFPIPYFALKRQLDAQDSLGFAFYGRGGMNTKWSGGTATFAPGGPGTTPMTLPGTFGSGTAGVDLMQAFATLGLAHVTMDRQLSLGIALTFAAQRFEARGLGAFAGYTETFAASGGRIMPTALSDNGHEMSYGGGASIGVEWRPLPKWAVAAAYTSKMYMSRLTAYSDLFADHGSFDIPASATVGLTFKPMPTLALSFDTQRIWYSQVAAVGDPVQNLFNCPTAGARGTDLQSCLGGSHGPGFGWRDMTVYYKIGIDWQINPTWTGRLGISHGTQPIRSSQMTFNILAPGVIQDHIAAGFTRHGAHGDFTLALTYAPNKTVTGPNVFDPTQTIALRMHQFDAEFGYAWHH